MKNIIAVFFVSALCLIGVANVEAASLRINPTKVRMIVPQGQSQSGSIEVENSSEESVTVKVYLEDWKYTAPQDGSKAFLPPDSTKNSCVNWVTTSLSDFVVPSYGRQILNFTVRVPQDAKGAHYAVLFFESLMGSANVKETANLGMLVRIGALFYIEPAGTINREAQITNLSVTSTKDAPLNISLDFKNSGNTDITTASSFNIMDDAGMILARGGFAEAYTFAGDSAKLTGSWKKPLPKGKYHLVITVDIGKVLEEAQLGRGPAITKEAEISIGENGKIISVGELL